MACLNAEVLDFRVKCNRGALLTYKKKNPNEFESSSGFSLTLKVETHVVTVKSHASTAKSHIKGLQVRFTPVNVRLASVCVRFLPVYERLTLIHVRLEIAPRLFSCPYSIRIIFSYSVPNKEC